MDHPERISNDEFVAKQQQQQQQQQQGDNNNDNGHDDDDVLNSNNNNKNSIKNSETAYSDDNNVDDETTSDMIIINDNHNNNSPQVDDDDDDDNEVIDDIEVNDDMIVGDDEDDLSSFEAACDGVEKDEFESFDIDFPLNEDRAIQLGRALIGNFSLEDLTIRLGHDMTPRGATALTGGVLGSQILHLAVHFTNNNNNGNRYDEPLPDNMTQLYVHPIRTVERISLLFPLNDHHASVIGECLRDTKYAVERLLVGVGRQCLLTPGDSGGAMALAKGIRESHLTGIDIVTDFEMGEQRRITTTTTTTKEMGQDSSSAAFAETMKILYRQGIYHCPSIAYHTLQGSAGDVYALASILPKLLRFVFTCAETLSVEDVQILGDGFRQSLQLQSLSMTECELGNEHIRALAAALGNHPSITDLDLQENNLGDDGISAFVLHWQQESRIDELNLKQNKIGPIGAQRLIHAMATHSSTMRILNLAMNPTIGYEGVKLIGQELPGVKLLQLHLQGTVNWIHYDDATCENAVIQETKRREAGQALLNGMRGNFYLEYLNVDGLNLPLNVTDELELYTDANRNERHLVLQQTALPPAFWCHFLSQEWQTSSFMFLFLRDLHVLMMPLHHCDESSAPNKKRRL